MLIDGGQVNDNFRRAVMNLKHVMYCRKLVPMSMTLSVIKLCLSREAVEMLGGALKMTKAAENMAQQDMYDIVRSPIITEKATRLAEQNQVVF